MQTLDLSSSLSALEALNPVSYLRIDQPGTGENLGFIAQQVQDSFLSSSDHISDRPYADGTLTFNYEGLISPFVSAIQGIANVTSSFQQNLIAWLGDASNGITDFFAENGHFLTNCASAQPASRLRIQAMVAAAGVSESSGQGSETASSYVRRRTISRLSS